MILFLADISIAKNADICAALRTRGHQVNCVDELDFSSMTAVRETIAEVKPDVIVVEGRMRDPEVAEVDPEKAFRENAEELIHVGAAALEFKVRVVLLSSAEVFGGKGGPWIESDEPHPPSTWAQSVLKGERFLSRLVKDLLILRTGPRLGKAVGLSTTPTNAANDETISPIWAEDLGMVIHELLEEGAHGLFHVAPIESPVTRYAYYSEIAKVSGARVNSKRGRELGLRAIYATSAGLESAKLAEGLIKKLRPWRSALSLLEVTAEPRETKKVSMAGEQEVRKVDKPWGHEIIWAHTDRYVGKILFVKAGERLSLQYHEKKDETVYVLSGRMLFEVGPKDGEREDIIMKKGQSYHITPHTVHRMVAIEDTEILEASTPELDDVVRLEDSYGRAGTSEP